MKFLKQWWLTFVLLALVAILLACQLDYLQLGNAATPTPARRPTLSATPTGVSDQSGLPPALSTTVPPQQPQQQLVPTQTPAPANVSATATDNLRIRSTPSTGGAIIGRLNKGETAQIIGRTAASDWWQIAVPTNPSQQGWVAAEFATPSGPTDTIPVVGASAPSAPVAPSGSNPPVAPGGSNPPPAQPAATPRPYPYP